MNMKAYNICIALVSTSMISGPAAADEEVEKEARPVPPPTQFVSEHRARFNDQTIDYTATAGETYVRDNDGEPKAGIFTFASHTHCRTENRCRVWPGKIA